MSGDDRVRFCGSCCKHVYNISDLSRAEAEAFLRDNGVSKCVKFYRKKDGTIITDDCPIGLRKIRDRARAVARLVASIIAVCLSFAAASAREPFRTKFPKEIVIVNDSPVSYPGRLAFRANVQLPPYAVLTAGKNALGDEIFKTDVDGVEQIYLREREVGAENTDVRKAKSLSGGVSATDLPSTLLAHEVFEKGTKYEHEGKLLTAESMYKITLKYFEQYPNDYDQNFKTSVVLRYAQLLRQLHRDEEVGRLLKDFTAESTTSP